MSEKQDTTITAQALSGMYERLVQFASTLSPEEQEAFGLILARAASVTPDQAEKYRPIIDRSQGEFSIPLLARALDGTSSLDSDLWSYTVWTYHHPR